MFEIEKVDTKKLEERRKRRLGKYYESIQEYVLDDSKKVIKSLVKERQRQGLTQNDIAEMTGMKAPNITRFEKGDRVPTLVALQKYALVLGKKVEITVKDL